MYDNLLIAGVVLIVIILYIYSYIKEGDISKKFFLYEKSIEDLNKKVFDLEQKITDRSRDKELKIELKEYIDKIVEENIEKISEYILLEKNQNSRKLEEFKNELYEKFSEIDKKIKNFNALPNEFHSNEKKIIELYNQGLNVSEIARRLRVGIGEVELVLKIEGIK